MVGLCGMLFERSIGWLPVYDLGVAFLVLAAGLTLWSMFGYIRAAWPGDGESDRVS
jgi:phosphatidylglycerophosphate synthase